MADALKEGPIAYIGTSGTGRHSFGQLMGIDPAAAVNPLQQSPGFTAGIKPKLLMHHPGISSVLGRCFRVAPGIDQVADQCMVEVLPVRILPQPLPADQNSLPDIVSFIGQ